LSAEPKSSAAGSCRFNQSFPNNYIINNPLRIARWQSAELLSGAMFLFSLALPIYLPGTPERNSRKGKNICCENGRNLL
ncbi:MAG: hypothetical protein J6L24_06255, partial [Oscillospiraceae bacterium]|nr:hypothetical protein [Oscillospiraceae bacterium]